MINLVKSEDNSSVLEATKQVKSLPTSKVENYSGVPTLFINGEPTVATAYMTYLDENACYDDFAKCGYKLFTFPTFFGGRGINVISGISPFRKGIFDEKGKADFSEFDHDIYKILEACSDAFIFPRINLMMPKWWEDENPEELNYLLNGESCRESFSSVKWRNDATNMLLELLDHIENSDYHKSIVGYHIADGGTEEWFHFGSPFGGLGECAKKGFLKYIDSKYPNEKEIIKDLPDFSVYNKCGEFLKDITLLRFLEYNSFIIADSICHFAKIIKDRINRRLIVGSFYGYTMELFDSRYGHHSLRAILVCDDIDFLSSPNSYMLDRIPGIDWACMSVLDSIKLNGKLYFSECDTRTYLTKPLAKCREGSCKEGTYIGPIWEGPTSPEVSRWVIRNSFCRNLTHANGQWWFDMWGGWFCDENILSEMEEYIKIGVASMQCKHRETISEVAVIVDEKSYKYINPNSMTSKKWCYDNRLFLGLSGVPYDIYDVNDIDRLPKEYKLLIFLSNLIYDEKIHLFLQTAVNTKCLFTYKPFHITKGDINHKNYMFSQELCLSNTLLRNAYKEADVHIWCESEDVIYVNENYISIHAKTEGDKVLNLGRKRKITPLLVDDDEAYVSDKIVCNLAQFETRLFCLD